MNHYVFSELTQIKAIPDDCGAVLLLGEMDLRLIQQLLPKENFTQGSVAMEHRCHTLGTSDAYLHTQRATYIRAADVVGCDVPW